MSRFHTVLLLSSKDPRVRMPDSPFLLRSLLLVLPHSMSSASVHGRGGALSHIETLRLQCTLYLYIPVLSLHTMSTYKLMNIHKFISSLDCKHSLFLNAPPTRENS